MSRAGATAPDLHRRRLAATRDRLTCTVAPAAAARPGGKRQHMATGGFWTGATATRGRNDHMAETCEDEMCPRLPCQMFHAGYRKGYARGYQDGYSAGYSAGYGAGYSAGFSAGLTAGGS